MTIKPLSDRVVVKQVEAEETTKTGIILTAAAQDGETVDLTDAEISYAFAPEGVVSIDETGKLTALAAGSTTLTITATLAGYVNTATTTVNFTVAEKAVEPEEPEIEYGFGQSVQIRLIEPWGLKANVRVYDKASQTSGGNINYDELYDYGAYFIRGSELGNAELNQATLTAEDIVGDADATKLSKAAGTAEVEYIDNNYVITSTYDKGLYTYEFADSIYVMFYIVTEEGAEPIYAPIRERNLATLIKERKTSGSFPADEKLVYEYMDKLHEDIVTYRAKFENPGVSGDQKAPTLGEYELGAPVESSKYKFGHTVQVRLIEPWGLKVNARAYTEGMGTTESIDYSGLEEYGVVVLLDNEKEYARAEEILENPNAYVFSSKNGDAEISGNAITAIYNRGLYTYLLDTDAYVMFYVKDAEGYHYGAIRNRNLYELMQERKGNASDFPEDERAIYDDMTKLHEAVVEYRKTRV